MIFRYAVSLYIIHIVYSHAKQPFLVRFSCFRWTLSPFYSFSLYIPLPFSLSLYPSPFHSLSLYLLPFTLSFYIPLSFTLSLFVSLCLPLCLPLSLSLSPSVSHSLSQFCPCFIITSSICGLQTDKFVINVLTFVVYESIQKDLVSDCTFLHFNCKLCYINISLCLLCCMA